MKQHTLFILKPGFYDNGEGPYYCPYCAAIEGMIKYIPEIEDEINVRRIDFPRPRQEIIELIGNENQGCPVWVLEKNTSIPRYAKISEETGRAFINGEINIGKYLSELLNTMIPH